MKLTTFKAIDMLVERYPALEETKSDELAQIEQIVREAMENVIALKVPLIVDIHHGKNWSEAK